METQENAAAVRDELDAVKAQLRATKRELSALRESKTWKLGNSLMRLMRLPYALAGRNIDRTASVHVANWLPFISGTVSFHSRDIRSVHLVLEVEHSDVMEQTVYRSTSGVTEFEIKYPASADIPSLAAVSLRTSSGQNLSPSPALFDSAPSKLERACQTVNRDDAKNFELSRFQDQDVALLSTFRPLGRGIEPLLVYLRALQQNDVRVILIDTSEDLPEDDQATLRSITDLYLRRENTGWDFSSWLSVISIFPDLEMMANRIFLLNDSNIGPLYDLSPLIRPHKTSKDNDVWGITESLQFAPHIQSYFIAFERTALDKMILSRFADRYEFPSNKNEIIFHGEVALTQFLLSNNLKVDVLIPHLTLIRRFQETFSDRLKARLDEWKTLEIFPSFTNLYYDDEIDWLLEIHSRTSSFNFLNPTHELWDLVYLAGSPFIKRELVTKNPMFVPRIARALEEILTPDALGLVMSELTIGNFSLREA